jgi:hypothetical protein
VTDVTIPRKEYVMEIAKTEVARMKKFAKVVGLTEVPKDPVAMRSSLMNFINEMPDGQCSKEVEDWFNMQVDLEEEVLAVEEKAGKLKEVKAKAEKAKAAPKTAPKAKAEAKSSVPKSPYNHRLSTQAGMMDEALRKGATLEEIEKEAGCTKGRIHGHMKHLEEKHCVKFETSKTGKIKIVKAA